MSLIQQRTPSEAEDLMVDAVAPEMPERFFDRFYFNLHAPDDPLPLVMIGLGIYPRQGVIDGWVIRCERDRQVNYRFSTELGRSDWRSVGPLAFETIEPLRQWRLTLGPNPTGVDGELVWTARTPPWATERLHLVAPSGQVSDFSHFFQPGAYGGQLRLDGSAVPVDGWLGTRDRSRGERLVTEGGGLHLWVQAQFPGHSVAFLYNEGRDHVITHCDGAVLVTDGSVDPIVTVDHDLNFDHQLDFRDGDLVVGTQSGRRYRLAVAGGVGGGYLSGGGYGGGHGRPRGLNWSEGETWELNGSVTPRMLDVPLTDRPATFTDADGAIGTGVIEFALTRSPRYSYAPSAPLAG